jgi:putative protease
MCISYSGRCLLSNYFTGRDANHGACTHPCRWKYALVEETRPGEYLPIEEDDRGSYIMNSRDLCMVGYIPELAEAGIDSFKIEGRMKNALYVATVARTYRKAIDAYLESAEAYEKILPWLKEQIAQCTYRKYSTGFYFGRPDADGQIYDESTYVSESIYLGTVRTVAEDGRIVITQKNKFSVGDGIEIMGTDGTDRQTQVLAMYDAEGNAIESCPHAGMEVHLKLSECAKAGEVLRMAAKEE